jgi:hypothetical protein
MPDIVRRARAAVDDLLDEQGAGGSDVADGARLLGGGLMLRATAERISLLAPGSDHPSACDRALAALQGDGTAVADAHRGLAAVLERNVPVTVPSHVEIGADRRQATLECLRELSGSDERERAKWALTIVWVGHSIVELARLADRLHGTALTLAAVDRRRLRS